MSTFDPNKYDRTESKGNFVENGFYDKRTRMIESFSKIIPIIKKECKSLESFIEKNPGHKAVSPFEEKLDGWSRILNGISIIQKMYTEKKN